MERKHRQIVEIGLTLMAHASLPFEYWDHSFQASVHLINRLPTPALNFDTPYHKLYGTLPDYGFLKVFGCSCFPLLRPYNQHKLQFRSEEYLFLGYSTSHKGYKCQSSSGRIFISKDVLFNEHSFPYKHLMLNKAFSSATTSFISSHIPTISLPHTTPSHPPDFPPIPSHTTVPNIVNSMSHPPITSSPATTSNSSPPPPPPSIPPTNTHPMQTRAKSGIVCP